MTECDTPEISNEENLFHFSVIIPTYNRSNIIKKCLDALSSQTFPTNQFEVIICDDGSTDDTEEVVEKYNSPFKLTYLKQYNRGPAAARNMGIKIAKCRYLLILNDDAILERDALSLHAEILERYKGEKISVLGKFVFLPEYVKSPFGYILENTRLLFHYSSMKAGHKYDFLYFCTCNISIEKQAIIDIGMFDEEFIGPASEDLEIGYRLEQKGYKVLYEPRIIAWHDHRQTPEDFCKVCKSRGLGKVTLKFKIPAISISYAISNATAVANLRKRHLKLKAKINDTLKYLIDIDHKSYENIRPEDFINITQQIFPLVKLIQEYYTYEGCLENPYLEKIINMHSEKMSCYKRWIFAMLPYLRAIILVLEDMRANYLLNQTFVKYKARCSTKESYQDFGKFISTWRTVYNKYLYNPLISAVVPCYIYIHTNYLEPIRKRGVKRILS